MEIFAYDNYLVLCTKILQLINSQQVNFAGYEGHFVDKLVILMKSSTPLLMANEFLNEIHRHEFNIPMYGFQGIFMAH